MKIAVCSDLHLEFGDITLHNDQQADVLVLSGDICVAKDLMEDNAAFANKSQKIHDFFKNCCLMFPHVVYVVGNHEHYHGDFKYTVRHLKEMLYYLPNLHILDKETFELGDYVFVGGTLWTDMNKGDPLTLFHIKSMMNDFNCVVNSNHMVTKTYPLYEQNLLYTPDGKNGGQYIKDEKGNMVIAGHKSKEVPSKFSPEDAMEDHKKMMDYIQIVTEFLGEHTKKFIVVGHHTPSTFSCHPRWAHDKLMNGGYHSDLVDFILDRPQIKLWTHGHTHEPFDYMIGSTRVVCNPRGYDGYEDISDRFELKYVEV
jgi:predicted phosphodiesterase